MTSTNKSTCFPEPETPKKGIESLLDQFALDDLYHIQALRRKKKVRVIRYNIGV